MVKVKGLSMETLPPCLLLSCSLLSRLSPHSAPFQVSQSLHPPRFCLRKLHPSKGVSTPWFLVLQTSVAKVQPDPKGDVQLSPVDKRKSGWVLLPKSEGEGGSWICSWSIPWEFAGKEDSWVSHKPTQPKSAFLQDPVGDSYTH